MVESLLQWEAYLHEPKMLKKHLHRLKKKHRVLMYLIKKIAPRTKGMGLKIMKFHAILHMVDDIFLYGVPMEFDTGANESHHKPSKVAAKLTQRHLTTFNIQVATRLFDFMLIDLAMVEIEEDLGRWMYYDDVTPWSEGMEVDDDGSESSSESSKNNQREEVDAWTGNT